MKYLLKKCGYQELGSIDSSGKTQRGRYLLISMSPETLDFFPPLSETQLNDFVPIACFPLFGPPRKVYCNFVYHNDKFHGSRAAYPRNEYRLYLNKDLEGGQNLFHKDDIVVFRKVENNENNENNVPLYVWHIPVGSSNYKEFLEKITISPFKGGYAVFDGEIRELEAKIPSDSKSGGTVTIDEKIIKSFGSASGIPSAAQLFNPVMFRDFLLVGYEGLCAITRTVIRHGNLMNIEAAHIRPRAHHGNYLPSNGLMLSRDLHWAFDKGFFSISDDYTVLVHPDSQSDLLAPLHGKKLFLPKDAFFRPNLENIRWHRNNLYGQFKIIRGIES